VINNTENVQTKLLVTGEYKKRRFHGDLIKKKNSAKDEQRKCGGCIRKPGKELAKRERIK